MANNIAPNKSCPRNVYTHSGLNNKLCSQNVDTLRGIEAVIELLKDNAENEIAPLSAEQHRAAIELVLANLRTVIDEIEGGSHGS